MPEIPTMPDYKIETARQKGMFKDLMRNLIKRDIPFDYINGVVSSPKALGNKEIWFAWGKMAVITPKDRAKNTLRGKLKTVKDIKWNRYEQMFDIVEGPGFSEEP